MPSSPAVLTEQDWKDRIASHLYTSLDAASEVITRSEAVQTWLQHATTEAAQELRNVSGMQGQMRGYAQMMDALETELPNLVAAVDDLTDGYGHLDLHWRPLQPNFSRLYVEFDVDYSVDLCVRLSACTPSAAQDTLAAIADALPDGTPFPGRPNRSTGFVVREGRGLGVRVNEHLHRDQSATYQSITLLSPSGDTTETLSRSDVLEPLLQSLCDEH